MAFVDFQLLYFQLNLSFLSPPGIKQEQYLKTCSQLTINPQGNSPIFTLEDMSRVMPQVIAPSLGLTSMTVGSGPSVDLKSFTETLKILLEVLEVLSLTQDPQSLISPLVCFQIWSTRLGVANRQTRESMAAPATLSLTSRISTLEWAR